MTNLFEKLMCRRLYESCTNLYQPVPTHTNMYCTNLYQPILTYTVPMPIVMSSTVQYVEMVQFDTNDFWMNFWINNCYSLVKIA